MRQLINEKLTIKNISDSLKSIRDIHVDDEFEILNVMRFEKGPRFVYGFLIHDNKGLPITIYENECNLNSRKIFDEEEGITCMQIEFG